MSAKLAAWDTPPVRLQLDEHQVHVWRAALDQTPPVLQALSCILSTDETVRAAKYIFQKDRDHFVVARGVLRNILSRYLNVAPEHLSFEYDEYGKPALSDASGGQSLRFNLSHSQGLALYALTIDRQIGINTEFIREDLELEQIAQQFFSQHEVAMLRALPAHLRADGFFNCWTRKEAYIKAVGLGFSLPLDQFVVSLIPGEPAALLSVAANPEEAFRWSLRDLRPELGYVAACAVEGHDWELASWQWKAAHA